VRCAVWRWRTRRSRNRYNGGLDGSGAYAGAWLAPDTLLRARSLGLDALGKLDDNDSFSFFDALGSTLVTGPTFTNINNFRAMLIEPAR
jgi:glycerate 2-kinase